MRRLMLVLFASGLGLVAPALAKPGPSPTTVTIAASPNPIVIGSPTQITGQVSGKKAAGAKIDLQAEPFPSSSFSTVSTATADAAGHYMFTVAPGVNTVYHVVARAAPSATSSNLLIQVRVKVTQRVSTTKPAVGQLVRFSGFVLPAYNGKTVLIQRKTATGWKTIAQAKLTAATPLGRIARSKYAKPIRFRKRGAYRVRFNPPKNANLPNSSPTRTLS